MIDILIKSAGVPIDRYSGEMVEQLKDIDARWSALRQIRESAAFAKDKDPAMTPIVQAPNADTYVIDASFEALQDKYERDYLNQLPTCFAPPDESVDRLRAAARTLILNSPDLRRAKGIRGRALSIGLLRLRPLHPLAYLESSCLRCDNNVASYRNNLESDPHDRLIC